VDDDDSIVNLLKKALIDAGHEVATAGDGVDAYEHVKSTNCDCMLLDVSMPKINGVELLLLMQADGIDVPTIVMAAFQDFEDGEMKSFTNVVHYLPKPFKLEEMVELVDRQLAS
jgi:DNA-binding NtrC family response regulator